MRTQTYLDAVWKAAEEDLPSGGCLVDPMSLGIHLKVPAAPTQSFSRLLTKIIRIFFSKHLQNTTTVDLKSICQINANVNHLKSPFVYVSDAHMQHRMPNNLKMMGTNFSPRNVLKGLSSATSMEKRYA